MIKRFSLVELLVCAVLIALMMSIISPGLRKSFHEARRVQCTVNQSNLYKLGIQISESPMDFYTNNLKSGTYTFNEWTGMFSAYQPGIDKSLLCPEDDRPTYQMVASNYRFHTTWMTGEDVKLEPGTRARIYATYTDPPGWRIGLEDWNDWDYNDLVVDIRIYPTSVEIKTVSADMAGDVNFIFVNGKLLISSLKSQIGIGISLPSGSPSSYGINDDLDCFLISGMNRCDNPSRKVFMMDYEQKVVYTGEDDWTQWVDSNGVYDFDRHSDKANVSYCDGSVRNVVSKMINPNLSDNLMCYWDIPNRWPTFASVGQIVTPPATTTTSTTTTTLTSITNTGHGGGRRR